MGEAGGEVNPNLFPMLGVALAFVLGMAVLLGGCGGAPTASSNDDGTVATYTTPDGRTVTCVIRGNDGVSCDWSTAR